MLSRRDFLCWTGAPLLAPAAMRLCPDRPRASPEQSPPGGCTQIWAEYRLTPHYRAAFSLDKVIQQTHPGHDAFPSEVYAEEVAEVLARWSESLRRNPASPSPLVELISPAIAASSLRPSTGKRVRGGPAFDIWRGDFRVAPALNREAFRRDLEAFVASVGHIRAAEFEVAGITIAQESPRRFATRIRYDVVGALSPKGSAERTGYWDLEWERGPGGNLLIRSWRPTEETRSRAAGPVFEDITAWALGGNTSYAQQMLRGTEYWRTVLDGACGIDVYGNNGVACGDIDNDGFDEIYVCQPAGLPNRLYRNLGDGRFEDVTEAAGVGVLDDTSCAVFADIDNDGNQDLIVVRAAGPLLFRNRGNGKFALEAEAFHFAQPPQGTFAGAALGDYDRDGWLDIYFSLYSYYEGIDQYRYPTPYFDARNGPANFLLRNHRDGTFRDVTAEAGLSQNNHHFSFDSGWCDYNHDGWADLYVVNDFGRKNLYRNNGDGTFTDVAEAAGVLDIGPGMSCAWFDYDNDGNQDLYVSDMWEPAGTRVSMQAAFMKDVSEDVRALYRRHAKGNSLFRNRGDGGFEDRSGPAGVEKAGWSWSCAAWDFAHEGRSDLYIANGMISGPDRYDLQGFFWRQVVAQSPANATPSRPYEEGWNAINELIRADGTWNGYQRNVFFANNGDGTFSRISGIAGLDFIDDSRSFALADLDHDGTLEVVLKNRTGPQLRILRNVMEGRGASICFRLRGRQSNRDAIGASVTVEGAAGRQVKFLQAGTGFFSQHSKELFFGLGRQAGAVRASVQWPSGLVQEFENLPPNHRIEVEEGSNEFHAVAFAPAPTIPEGAGFEQKPEPPPVCCATWLLDALPAPDFTLPGLDGLSYSLSSFHGRHVLLHFWDMSLPSCQPAIEQLQKSYPAWTDQGVQLLALHAYAAAGEDTVRDFARKMRLNYPVLLATEYVLGSYNLLYRYLFDRRRNLGIPTTLLVDPEGLIVRVYQGPLDASTVEDDLRHVPKTASERQSRALPFAGKYYGGGFQRNLFTYGVAFTRAGYYDEAIGWFQQVIRQNPKYAAAYYNLGTLYLNKGALTQAEEHLRRATELTPGDASAWNNLGMATAQAGRANDAIKYFQEAIRQDPHHVIALENLGKLYQDGGRFEDAQKIFARALEIEPDSPEANYHLGMLYAQHGDSDPAREFLEKAIQLRPVYPEALNNLGVLNLRTGNLTEAKAALEECIRVAPSFEVAYLNLAKVYVAMGKPEQARATLQRLLTLHPGYPAAQQALRDLAL